MSETKQNIRKKHIHGKEVGIKKKNIFELKDEFIKDNIFPNRFTNFKNILDYAESLLLIANGLVPQELIELQYSEKNSIFNLVSDLELILSKTPNDFSNFTDENKVTIYSNSKEDFGDIAVGIPNISPNLLYIVYMDWIFRFESEEMKIGFAHFLQNYLKLIDSNEDLKTRKIADPINDFYRYCDMEVESFTDMETEEDDYCEFSPPRLKRYLEKPSKYIQNVFKEVKKYLRKPYSDFEKYQPKNIWEQDIKSYILILKPVLSSGFSKFIPSTYGYDMSMVEIETLFRIFPEENGFSSYEIDCFESYSQEGVCPLESVVFMKNGKPDFESYEKSINDFYLMLENLESLIDKILQ